MITTLFAALLLASAANPAGAAELDPDLALEYGKLAQSVKEQAIERASKPATPEGREGPSWGPRFEYIEIRNLNDNALMGLLPIPGDDFHDTAAFETETGAQVAGGELKLVLSTHLYTDPVGKPYREKRGGDGRTHRNQRALERNRVEAQWRSPSSEGWYYRFGAAYSQDKFDKGLPVGMLAQQEHWHDWNRYQDYDEVPAGRSTYGASAIMGGGREGFAGGFSGKADAGFELDTRGVRSNVQAGLEGAILDERRQKLLVTSLEVKTYADGTCDVSLGFAANVYGSMHGQCVAAGTGIIFPLQRSHTQYFGLNDAHAPVYALSLTLGRKP